MIWPGSHNCCELWEGEEQEKQPVYIANDFILLLFSSGLADDQRTKVEFTSGLKEE